MPSLTVKTIQACVFAKYQPIIDLNHNRMVACEALARWRSPDGTESSIEPFVDEIEVNEEHVLALTHRIFTCIKADLGEILVEFPHFSVGMNLPPILIGKEKIMPIIEREGLTDHLAQLTGEITERQALSEQGRIALRLARQLGGKIAIDDFGTGQSGLQQLLGFEANILKIDRSFVSLIGKDLSAERLVRGIAALATVLKMSIVAEGVETQEQAAFLRAIGVEKGQGWLWSKAIGPSELRTWLA